MPRNRLQPNILGEILLVLLLGGVLGIFAQGFPLDGDLEGIITSWVGPGTGVLASTIFDRIYGVVLITNDDEQQQELLSLEINT